MLDRDLAALYEVETKALNLAVKRNSKRFPRDFMFQLTKEEFESIRFQFETLDRKAKSLRLQNETLKKGRGQHSKYLPYAFTEQGVAMLSVRHIDKPSRYSFVYWEFSSAGSEHLPYKQRVGGSNPSTPTGFERRPSSRVRVSVKTGTLFY